MNTIIDAIAIKPGNIFSKKDIFLTKRNFFYIKNFLIKEIKIKKILTNPINNIGKLNVDIFLTPLKKYETQLYFETYISNVFNININSGIKILKRNIFKNGEFLDFSLKKNFYLINKKINYSNIEFDNFIYNIQANLYFPYFFYPLKYFYIKKYNTRSNINIQIDIKNNKNIIYTNNIEYLWDTNYYSRHKINFFFLKKIKELFLNISSNKFSNLDLGLDKKYYIYNNIILKYKKNKLFNFIKNYNNLFYNKINYISYIYHYNQFLNKKNKKPIFFSIKIETSNNMFYLLNKYFFKKKNNYYNFFKINIELKKYWIFTKVKLLISRFFIGINIPYHYNKLKFFYIKNNDIRAWHTYSLGPGIIKKNSIISNFSDLKIILNIEYRLKILYNTYIAFFIDTGNIWLLKSKNKKSIFNINNFYKQLALSYGLGLRYDLKYIILRIDLSHKLIDPTKNCWNKSILHNNIINFAIGYPF